MKVQISELARLANDIALIKMGSLKLGTKYGNEI